MGFWTMPPSANCAAARSKPLLFRAIKCRMPAVNCRLRVPEESSRRVLTHSSPSRLGRPGACLLVAQASGLRLTTATMLERGIPMRSCLGTPISQLALEISTLRASQRRCACAPVLVLALGAATAAFAQSPVQSCNVSGTKPPFCGAVPGDRSEGWLRQGRSETMSQHGMVTTSQSVAAQAGLRILMKGGNAVDAAVATAV